MNPQITLSPYAHLSHMVVVIDGGMAVAKQKPGHNVAKRPNTTAVGDDFRDKVADLLKASGVEAQVEILIGSKRVDIYFEETRFARRRYAVEAKKYSRGLTHDDLTKIYGGYATLLGREIDQILVISPHPVTAPAANRFLQDQPNITHLTFAEFQETLLRFGPFLRSFLHRHDEGGLENYFMPPLLANGSDLVDFLEDWMESDDGDPIAIIAGYGMGKTSLAQHLTYKLAKAFFAGGMGRVPVLVSLGGISREQGLEGLMATALTGGSPAVGNFNFPMFAMLNQAGRFLVILDGFDEMKHMMSEAEFRSNFDELNRLVGGKAKVLLLGRPTAFLSENEQDYVLRGRRRIGDKLLKAPGAPDYTELRLQSFEPEQVRGFLAAYFNFHFASGRIGGDKAFADRRLSELQNSEHDELMSRPVHARMLADLATDPAFEIGQLTRFQLYDHFIDHLIARETTKLGRGNLLKNVDRRAFSQDLAWHLWILPSGSSLGCRFEDLPDELFEPYLPSSEEPTTLRRALLSGSFLDEKSYGVFYFAHRSFQEFLVAEYIWSNLTADSEMSPSIIDGMDVALTQEVFDFLIERDDRSFFRGMLSELSAHQASLPVDVFVALSSSGLMREIAAGKGANNITAWDAGIVLAGALIHDVIGDEEVLRIGEQVAARAARKPGVLLSAIKTVLVLLDHASLNTALSYDLLVSLMFVRGKEDIGLLSEASFSRRKSKGDALRDSIFETVSAEMTPEEGLMMSLEIRPLFDIVASTAHQPIQAVPREMQLHAMVHRAPFADFFRRIPEPSRRQLYEFYQKDAAIGAPFVRGGTRKWSEDNDQSPDPLYD